MAASILAAGETIIHNCPNLTDVDAAIKILVHLGCKVERTEDTVYIDSSSLTRCSIPDSLMREMRSSVIFLGAILARTGEALSLIHILLERSHRSAPGYQRGDIRYGLRHIGTGCRRGRRYRQQRLCRCV